jgi:phosphate transport system substrate-binding protein
MRRVFPVVLWVTLGCRPPSPVLSISVKGSDTLVQVASGWAERYSHKVRQVSVNATGGGSGTGIAGLIDGTVDVATASREMKDEERAAVLKTRGLEVHQLVVGADALALFVHLSNPVQELSLEQLSEIWSEFGVFTDWSHLTPALSGKVVLIGRQNSSGTYDYFREVVCGHAADGHAREFRGGVSELTGSSEVVEKVATAPLALGYSGMGYATEDVKTVAISAPGKQAVQPSIEAVLSGAYPLSRKLYVYTVGQPPEPVQAFLDWLISPEGQEIVAREGYVPVQ